MLHRELATTCLLLLAGQAAAAQSLGGSALEHPDVPPPHHPLSYVEAAGPLTPFMEGGRTELEWGDVNGDGHPDLVSIGDHGSPNINSQQHGVMTWLGDGASGFAVIQVGDFGYGGVALGDVDGAGLMDVGYGMHHDYSSTDLGDQLIEVALGDGTATAFTPWDDGLATGGETYGMFGTDFGDVDADGDLDLGSESFGCCAGAHVYRNQGNGSWSQSWGFTGGNSNMDFLFADFDGDGLLDACVANSLGTAWLGDGAGGWQFVLQFTTPGINSKAFEAFRAGGDFDHNGYPDFAVVQDEGSLFSGGNPLRVFREDSVASQRSLRVTAPTPARTWRAGQVAWVDWLSAVPPGQPLGSVDVELSYSGAGGPYLPLASGLPNNGRAQVTLPAALPTPNAWLRVTVTAPGVVLHDLAGPVRIVP